MNINAVKDILKGIAEECKMLMKQSLTQHGQNSPQKMQRKDTLTNSNLYNEIEVKSDGKGLIEILVNDYINYIESGRDSGSFPPIASIARWASEKNITNDNNIVWAIAKSIYKNGIKPRPIVEIPKNMYGTPSNSNDLLFDVIDEFWDDWSNQICDAACQELDALFNN